MLEASPVARFDFRDCAGTALSYWNNDTHTYSQTEFLWFIHYEVSASLEAGPHCVLTL